MQVIQIKKRYFLKIILQVFLNVRSLIKVISLFYYLDSSSNI